MSIGTTHIIDPSSVITSSVITSSVIAPSVIAPSTAPTPPPVVRRSVVRSPAVPPVPREIAAWMGQRQELWRPLVRFGDPRFATRLVAGSGWEAWLLSWLPGQSTRLHDHGGSAGAFMVVAGELDESILVPRAVLAGQTPRLGLATQRYRAGEIRAFGPDHVHDVASRAGGRAVSLHVYSPRLSAMTRYALDLEGELTVASRERVGVDW